MLPMELLKEFSELDQQKDNLERQVKELKERMAEIEPIIIEAMQLEGVQHLKINGRTPYLHRSLWAKVSDQDRAIQILKEAGYGYLVREKYNSNQISELVREMVRSGEGLPEVFGDTISFEERVRLRVK